MLCVSSGYLWRVAGVWRSRANYSLCEWDRGTNRGRISLFFFFFSFIFLVLFLFLSFFLLFSFLSFISFLYFSYHFTYYVHMIPPWYIIPRKLLLCFLASSDTGVLSQTTRCLSLCFAHQEARIVEQHQHLVELLLGCLTFILQSSTNGERLWFFSSSSLPLNLMNRWTFEVYFFTLTRAYGGFRNSSG